MRLKLTVLLLFLGSGDCARILGVVPTPSYSHQIAFRPIWKELSLRGHQVTVVTTDPVRDSSLTNLTEIDISITYEIMKKHRWNEFLFEVKEDMLKVWQFYLNIGKELHDAIFSVPEMNDLVRNKSIKFDLVMIEYINPIMFAFAHTFNASFIAISSLEVSYLAHDCLGNPSHPVLNPDVFLPFSDHLTFFQRVISTGFSIYMRLFFKQMLALSDIATSEYFGEDYPPMEEIACRLDMLFMNVNPIFNTVRPTVPAVVSISGGTHFEEAKPLPKDLQEYLDSSPNGVIYFSLGTNIQSKLMPQNMIKDAVEAFSELPYNVIWKFEEEEIPGKPENVKLVRWLPQQDLLRHPNVKLFITQGGIQSLEEAMFNHVPMIGIPFFGDQYSNVNQMVHKGLGLKIDYTKFHKDDFLRKIFEVINNPSYREKAIEITNLSLDQPMTGLEKAVWWTEYVLRHKGAQHLKGPASQLPLYQYFLLDVLAFLFIVVFLFVLAVYYLCKCTIKRIKSKRLHKLKKQ